MCLQRYPGWCPQRQAHGRTAFRATAWRELHSFAQLYTELPHSYVKDGDADISPDMDILLGHHTQGNGHIQKDVPCMVPLSGGPWSPHRTGRPEPESGSGKVVGSSLEKGKTWGGGGKF